MKERVILVLLCVTLLTMILPTGVAAASGEYQNASAWAVPELDKAAGYGLITNKIKNNMAASITREEFAEIAIRLYETYTGKEAETGGESFSDTKNPEILKAANLKITSGIGGGKFGPDLLVTREQIATFLLRTLKAMDPDGEYSLAAGSRFSDDTLIDSWAKEGVYYCSRVGIIKGIDNKDGTFRFDPDNNSSREVAAIVCTRAYEWFVGNVKEQPGGKEIPGQPGEEEWNGSIIILDNAFEKDEYQIKELDGESFIFLPFERFKYVFKMPSIGYKYPEVSLKDGQISIGWKDDAGEVILQVDMNVGSNTAYLYGGEFDLTTGPYQVGDTVYVPVNLFFELFEMQMSMFQGRLCFQYPSQFSGEILQGTWSTSQVSLFTGYRDMVSGVISLPSFDWSYTFNPDGTYRMLAVSSGGYHDTLIMQTGKYKVIGNTIIYYEQVETVYKGNPLVLLYENKFMGDRLEYDFIDDYDQEEDKIEMDLNWYHRVKD